MVVFIGAVDEGYFAKSIVENRDESFQVISGLGKTSDIVVEVQRTRADVVIWDVSPYEGEPDYIVGCAEKIVRALNCRFIIYAPCFLPGSRLIQAFYNAGYVDFITSGMLAYKQQELTNCLDGVYTRDGAPEDIVKAYEDFRRDNPLSKKEEAAQIKAINESKKRRITIGVAGARHYVGTTTQVLQIAKYLIQKDRTVAVVEMNNSGFFRKWMELEEDKNYKYDSGIELLTFKEVDIFLNPEQITKKIRQRYECLVYDYGCYFDSDFERMSYYEKDVNCMVGGSKVSEYEYTNQALAENADRDNMYFIFSFTSEAEAKNIKESMKALGSRTLFPAYTPDMFVYSPENKYDGFFKFKLQQDKKAEKKGFRFFRKKAVATE